MAFTRFDKDTANISKLSNRPNQHDGLSAAQLKGRFDKAGVDIKDFINEVLIGELESESGADNIGSTPLVVGGSTTVRGQLGELNTALETKADNVNIYTKTNLQTEGQSVVHWGNLIHVPNLADGHWKTPVADKASLPLSGNELGDNRVVLDDGDGKQAVYTCIAVTGDMPTQWAKIGDVDWNSEEATRVAQENQRVIDEDLRKTAEESRVSAESLRATAETTRLSNESARVSNEGTRATNELERVSLYNNISNMLATGQLKGDKGDKGDTGLQGIQGLKGDKGDRGLKGDKPTHRWIDTSLQVENPDGTWGDAVNLKGESGEGSGNMHTSTYDTTGKNTDIFNYVDTGLSGKVDNARVLTDVPLNAKFTDTVYSHPPTHPASMITDLPTGKKVARFVVGTSTAGWTTADCDYLCDGTADQTEINAAITALPATGGEIVILDGTYNITAKIYVNKINVSIRGNGNATRLKRMYDSSDLEGIITLTQAIGCTVEKLYIDGNKANYSSYSNVGINLSSSSNNTITGNTCNSDGAGISLTYDSNNNTITGNTCINTDSGIYLYSSSNNTITGSICNINTNAGINLDSSSNNTITGNTCNNNYYGIFLTYDSNNNTNTGNTCNNNNSAGINLDSSSNNTITGNTCIRGTGLPENYVSYQHTIQLSGTSNNYNLIAMNNCMGKAVTNEGGTGNTLVNNKFDDSDDIQALADLVSTNKEEFDTHLIKFASLFPNNAGAHNSIYRGKYLGSSVTAEQYLAISSGTFEDLYIGDYWTINGVNWRIAAFNYYRNTGDSLVPGNHLVIVSDESLYSHVMNDTNTTDGGYIGSKMYIEGLEQAKTIINNAFSGHVVTFRAYLCNAVTDGEASAGGWVDSTVDLMNEIMVYGSVVNGRSTYGLYNIGTEKSQLPLFALNPQFINTRYSYWLRDIASASRFARAYNHGLATHYSASNSYAVRPRFLIS